LKKPARSFLSLAFDALVSVVAAAAALFVYSLFGAATGVFGMCAWAPAWWFYTYLIMVPVVAIGAMVLVLLARHGYVLKRKSQGEEEAVWLDSGRTDS
jgi:hypothetical protein